jgi:hypothetical protein
MLTKTQIIVAMRNLDDVILNGNAEESRAAYLEHVRYGEMLFNRKYVY